MGQFTDGVAPSIADIAGAVAKNPGFMVKGVMRGGGALTELSTKFAESSAGAALTDFADLSPKMDPATYGVNVLWHGRSVATRLYADVKKAVS